MGDVENKGGEEAIADPDVSIKQPGKYTGYHDQYDVYYAPDVNDVIVILGMHQPEHDGRCIKENRELGVEDLFLEKKGNRASAREGDKAS